MRRLLLALVILASISGKRHKDKKQYWEWQEFPNPQIRPAQCGNVQVGWLCDPAHVLSADEAARVEAAAADVRQSTKCRCSDRSRCAEFGGHGFTVAVAVVPHMTMPIGVTKSEKTRYARKFAEKLRDQYKFGQCEDDILIFLSEKDRKIYTDVGPGVREHLNQDKLQQIFQAERKYFANSKYADGFVKLIESYGRELKPREYRRQHEYRHEPGEPMPGWVVALIVFLVIGCGLSVCFCSCHAKKKTEERKKKAPVVINGEEGIPLGPLKPPPEEEDSDPSPLPPIVPEKDVHYERRHHDEDAVTPTHGGGAHDPYPGHWSPSEGGSGRDVRRNSLSSVEDVPNAHTGAGGDF